MLLHIRANPCHLRAEGGMCCRVGYRKRPVFRFRGNAGQPHVLDGPGVTALPEQGIVVPAIVRDHMDLCHLKDDGLTILDTDLHGAVPLNPGSPSGME